MDQSGRHRPGAGLGECEVGSSGPYSYPSPTARLPDDREANLSGRVPPPSSTARPAVVMRVDVPDTGPLSLLRSSPWYPAQPMGRTRSRAHIRPADPAVNGWRGGSVRYNDPMPRRLDHEAAAAIMRAGEGRPSRGAMLDPSRCRVEVSSNDRRWRAAVEVTRPGHSCHRTRCENRSTVRLLTPRKRLDILRLRRGRAERV